MSKKDEPFVPPELEGIEPLPPSKKPGVVSSYNREYYEDKKERIARRKKYRYDNDPEYREAIKARAAEQRRLRRLENAKKRAAGEKKDRLAKIKRSRVVLEDGTKIVTNIYSIGQAAGALNISTQTIRKWEKEGVLPDTFRTEGGHRFYTEAQVEVMIAVYKKHYATTQPWRLTSEFVKEMQDSLAAITYD